MSAKRFALLKRFIVDNGLQMVDNGTDGTRWFVMAKAANGRTQKFSLSKKEGDIRADLNEAARIKRFAAGNDVEEVEMEATAEHNLNPLVALANGVAARVPVKVKGRRRLTLSIVGSGAQEPPTDVVATTPSPSAEPAPQGPEKALGEALDERPKTKTGARRHPDPSKRINRLTQHEFYQVMKIVEGLDTMQFADLAELAAELTKRTGFAVSRYSAGEACKTLGKLTRYQVTRREAVAARAKGASPKVMKGKDDLTTVARCMVSLFEHLGEPVPDELKRLAR